jgi:excisionase family DNA binding protein
MLTVGEIAERYGVTEHTVLGWIRSGELKAVNVGRRAGSKKPRWRVSQAAVAAFEAARSATPATEGRRVKRAAEADVVKFYG